MAKRLSANLSSTKLREIMGSQDVDRLYGFLNQLAFIDVMGFRDDFTGPVIDTNHWTAGNGGGASAASPAIDVGVVNGAIKMVTGTAGDNTACSTLAGGRHMYGQNNAIIVCRLAIQTAVTNVKVEVGFRDAVTTTAGAAQVVNVAATPTFVATDGSVWCFDTNNTTTWKGISVANGTAATTLATGITPVAGAYETVAIALIDGVATFSHFAVGGGRDYGPTSQAAAVTSTVLLSPHVYVEARSVTSKQLDVDAVYVWQNRTTANT